MTPLSLHNSITSAENIANITPLCKQLLKFPTMQEPWNIRASGLQRSPGAWGHPRRTQRVGQCMLFKTRWPKGPTLGTTGPKGLIMGLCTGHQQLSTVNQLMHLFDEQLNNLSFGHDGRRGLRMRGIRSVVLTAGCRSSLSGGYPSTATLQSREAERVHTGPIGSTCRVHRAHIGHGAHGPMRANRPTRTIGLELMCTWGLTLVLIFYSSWDTQPHATC